MTVRGLEGVVAGTTYLSSIVNGVLRYRGINIDDLAEHASYEEVVYLLLFGNLPTRAQLDDLTSRLQAKRALPDDVLNLMRVIPKNALPMDSLRTVVSALGTYEENPSDTSAEASMDKAIHLIAQVPTAVAAVHRLHQGQEPVPPPSDGDTAEAFMTMLKGSTPEPIEVEAMNKILVLHADHEFNASTFTARVVAATLADMHAAVTAAIAALKGPLHGGANAAVMASLTEIGTVDKVEPYVLDRLAKRQLIMGFGHRVYKQGDPRAKWLKEMSRQLGELRGEPKWYKMSVKMDEVMLREKGLHPNVDFYAATVYHYLGIPTDTMTAVFASSRISGWTAHVLEQYADNRLIRPRADYQGPAAQPWVPIEKRG